MIKKIIKYGNSNALVLDRSILALLDIKEGGFVKLRIEGDTLIIKREQDAKVIDLLVAEIEDSISGTILEPQLQCYKKNADDYLNKLDNDPNLMEKLKQFAPGTEKFKKMQEEFGKILLKYKGELKIFSSEEVQKELENLNKKYGNKFIDADYLKEVSVLRLKYCPTYAQIEKEMDDVKKAMGCVDSLLI